MLQTKSQYDPTKYKTPTGTTMSCKGWIQEAALRMLLNNLNPEVAERPEELIVYGGRGKAARNFEALDNIIKALKILENDESLLVQSGKPVGILKTHKDAPRILISNSQLVPKWATWEHFDELEKKGLMMYGQMTAGSWIYIGSQGIVQGTYETYSAAANKHFGGTLRGTLNVTAGLGGMGGAQPLAITMNEGVALIAEVEQRRIDNPQQYTDFAYQSMYRHVECMLELQSRGAITFDYGNNLTARAAERGLKNAFGFPGFVPAYIRPLFCEGKGPFRWAALSGDPDDIAATDRAILELFPDNERLRKWITMAGERVHFQGLPARICWLGYGERHQAGLKFNEMVASGELKAPIVIGRDHLDCGSVASPYRETEAMLDGSDAIADWAILNALLNTSSGASWVSVHHGGGVGIGRSIHAGMVVVADGTDEAARKLDRVRTNDPGTGVMRHADAGYERAIDVARERGVRIPMRD